MKIFARFACLHIMYIRGQITRLLSLSIDSFQPETRGDEGLRGVHKQTETFHWIFVNYSGEPSESRVSILCVCMDDAARHNASVYMLKWNFNVSCAYARGSPETTPHQIITVSLFPPLLPPPPPQTHLRAQRIHNLHTHILHAHWIWSDWYS